MGTHAAAVAFYPNLAYRPDIDFAPIGLVSWAPVMIVARRDFPAKDLHEFAAYVKANAERLNMAHDRRWLNHVHLRFAVQLDH